MTTEPAKGRECRWSRGDVVMENKPESAEGRIETAKGPVRRLGRQSWLWGAPLSLLPLSPAHPSLSLYGVLL